MAEHEQSLDLLGLLHQAVHSTTGSQKRWAARRAGRLSDAEVLTAYNEEAGKHFFGTGGKGAFIQCRPGLFEWELNSSTKGAMAGKVLSRALRQALHLEGTATLQTTLFA